MLRKKHEARLDDEQVKPLAGYRIKELERMKINFFGPDPAYHEARRHFVFKGNPPPHNGRAPAGVQIKCRPRCTQNGWPSQCRFPRPALPHEIEPPKRLTESRIINLSPGVQPNPKRALICGCRPRRNINAIDYGAPLPLVLLQKTGL